jgi:hypothetical protein
MGLSGVTAFVSFPDRFKFLNNFVDAARQQSGKIQIPECVKSR